MLEKLAKARNLAKANNAIKRLISERGESNAVSMADDVVNNYRKLTKDQYVAFFTYLFEKLNPDAASVMEAAQNIWIRFVNREVHQSNTLHHLIPAEQGGKFNGIPH